MNLPFYLARKFYRGAPENQSKHRASVPAVRVATAGVALGLIVMIVSVGIVSGFKAEINKKLSGLSAHAELVNIGSFAAPDAYPITADSLLEAQIKQAQGVKHLQRFAEKMGVLKTESDFQVIALKGISADYDRAFIESCIIEGELPDFNDSLSANKIVISSTHAAQLNLGVGDKVFAYFFEETIKMRRFTISGIYQTNIKQYDRNLALVGLRTIQKLNNWTEQEIGGYEIYSDEKQPLSEWTQQLSLSLSPMLQTPALDNCQIIGLKDNPRTMQVVGWLSLLDMNIWLILALVALVAIFSMSAGLLILILERTSDVGVLQALGTTRRRIRHIFLYYAAFIVLRGLLIGNIIGLGILWLQHQYGFIKLNPETYYVSVLPVTISWQAIILLNLATFAVTLLALLVPSLLVNRIQPARAIRFD